VNKFQDNKELLGRFIDAVLDISEAAVGRSIIWAVSKLLRVSCNYPKLLDRSSYASILKQVELYKIHSGIFNL